MIALILLLAASHQLGLDPTPVIEEGLMITGMLNHEYYYSFSMAQLGLSWSERFAQHYVSTESSAERYLSLDIEHLSVSGLPDKVDKVDKVTGEYTIWWLCRAIVSLIAALVPSLTLKFLR